MITSTVHGDSTLLYCIISSQSPFLSPYGNTNKALPPLSSIPINSNLPNSADHGAGRDNGSTEESVLEAG